MARASYSATPLALARSSPTRRYTGMYLKMLPRQNDKPSKFCHISALLIFASICRTWSEETVTSRSSFSVSSRLPISVSSRPCRSLVKSQRHSPSAVADPSNAKSYSCIKHVFLCFHHAKLVNLSSSLSPNSGSHN